MLGVFEVLIVLVLIWFVEKFLREEVEYFKKTREKMVPSAARYTVMVKGERMRFELEEIFFRGGYLTHKHEHVNFRITAGCN